MMQLPRWIAAATVALALGAAPAMAQDAGIAVGSKAPAVVLKTLDGKSVDLGKLNGKKPYMIEFWATWCSNCEEMLPSVKAAAAKYGKDVEFYGVNVTVNQTKERVQRYLAKHQPPYVTLWDDTGVSTRAFDVPTTSFIVIVDKSGVVRYAALGAEQNIDAPLKLVAGK
jgi:thiol-disulfide isomerase/thioredoxin